jgi:hypothetical protein
MYNKHAMLVLCISSERNKLNVALSISLLLFWFLWIWSGWTIERYLDEDLKDVMRDGKKVYLCVETMCETL